MPTNIEILATKSRHESMFSTQNKSFKSEFYGLSCGSKNSMYETEKNLKHEQTINFVRALGLDQINGTLEITRSNFKK